MCQIITLKPSTTVIKFMFSNPRNPIENNKIIDLNNLVPLYDSVLIVIILEQVSKTVSTKNMVAWYS